MKHHKYNLGWREANRMTRQEVIEEIVIIGGIYMAVMGLMILVVYLLAK